MSLSTHRWYTAISLRHSVRRYTGEAVPDDILDSLDRLIAEFRPFRGARAVLVRTPSRQFVRRFIGVLDKSGVVHYVAFLGDMTNLHVQEVTGYIGEAVVLEATALGLNTCWIAALLRKESIAREVGAGPNEQVLAITPVGYAENESERVESLRRGPARPHNRKPLEKLVIAGDATQNDWSQSALEAARLAPSAVNRQPWRFSIDDRSITVSAAELRYSFGVSPRLDCGIATLHLQLGAMIKGVECRVDFLEPPDVARLSVQ
ncbi:MAG: nitroreductase family protein [Candidatus Thorarchaeota archaeon]|nr:nitroreductase family protein [Candidatus Thorarchaeota archaeon]